MSLPPLTEVEAEEASAICARTFLDPSVRALAEPGMDPRRYLERLLERGCHTEAVHFLAHGLSKPLAIRWAYLAAASMEAPSPPEEVAEAEGEAPPRPPLRIAEDWLEEAALGTAAEEARLAALREEALRSAEARAYAGAESWVAAAIASSVPPEGVEDPAPFEATPLSQAAGAILLAAGEGAETIVEDHDDQYLRLLERFLGAGIALASGRPAAEPVSLEAYFPKDPSRGRIKARVDRLEDLSELRQASAREPARESARSAKQGEQGER